MDLKKHYKALYQTYGNSANAVQYTDTDSQIKRFQILTQIDSKLNSVIDLGCGLGHLYAYLTEKEKDIRFLGLDFVEEFVKEAAQKYQEKQAKFKVFNITEDNIPKGYDYIILSGVFNNVMNDNWKFMKDALIKMYESCNKGIAFNAMSTYVDYYDEHLFYIDPCKVFHFCKQKLSRRVALRNDYVVKENSIPFEFTIYVYKE